MGINNSQYGEKDARDGLERLRRRERQIEALMSMVDRRATGTGADSVAENPPGKLGISIGKLMREFYRITGQRGKFAHQAGRVAAMKMAEARARQGSVEPDPTYGIMSTPHTLFVAHLISKALASYGIRSVLIGVEDEHDFALPVYFVLCPQMFRRLPPAGRRICFQFEQTVSERWMTTQYMEILRDSLAMLDYSMDNLRYFEDRHIRFPHTFYLPVECLVGYDPYGVGRPAGDWEGRDIELVFYGDSNVPRRRAILDELRRHFNLVEVTNSFGAELHRTLARSRVVINLHYYENALLETTRIHECLSLGLRVVSEDSANRGEYPSVASGVRFVDAGDIEGMIRAIKAELEPAPTLPSMSPASSEARFVLNLGRVLLALGLISYKTFEDAQAAWRLNGNRICLSLPETIQRRRAADQSKPDGTSYFDGLRHKQGWIGCAMSYKFLCRRALAQGEEAIFICEDDALLDAEAWETLQQVLHAHREDPLSWDIFCGLIADLNEDAQVYDVEVVNGRMLVTLDRMTSMVCNIYGRRAMRIIGQWDETLEDPENTIDRYLERHPGLRIATTLPFLAKHREDVHSTLWDFSNSRYAEMIAKSEDILREKVESFLSSRGGIPGA